MEAFGIGQEAGVKVDGLVRVGLRSIGQVSGCKERIDEDIGGDSVCFGLEVGHESVANHRLGQCLEVFHIHCVPTGQDGAGLGGQDEVLGGAWACSLGYVL